MPLETLDEMLTVISNSSLVPEVEAQNSSQHLEILAQLTRHHVTVFQAIGSDDLVALRRVRRTPGKDSLFGYSHEMDGDDLRQGQLAKLFPSLKVAPLSWNERRVSAKRNLEKLFDKLATKKANTYKQAKTTTTTTMGHLGQQAKEGIKGRIAGAAELTKEEKIFLSSDNPRFPKDDITVSMIDRRGDVNAKDYDYVEYGREEKVRKKTKQEVLADLSEEVSFVRDNSKHRYGTLADQRGKTVVTTSSVNAKGSRDLELWEMEAPKESRKHRYGMGGHEEQEEEEEDYHHGLYSARPGGPNYNNNDEDDDELYGQGSAHDNYTGDAFYYPQKIKKTRMRRDIFDSAQPIEGAVQGIFQDIRDYYPKMLQRLASAVVRPKRDDELLVQPPSLILPESNNIESLLEGATHDLLGGAFVSRKIRSSPSFIRTDPETNEIGYKLPRPITLRPIQFRGRSAEDAAPVNSFVSKFLKRWHAFQEQLKGFFTS